MVVRSVCVSHLKLRMEDKGRPVSGLYNNIYIILYLYVKPM